MQHALKAIRIASVACLIGASGCAAAAEVYLDLREASVVHSVAGLAALVCGAAIATAVSGVIGMIR